MWRYWLNEEAEITERRMEGTMQVLSSASGVVESCARKRGLVDNGSEAWYAGYTSRIIVSLDEGLGHVDGARPRRFPVLAVRRYRLRETRQRGVREARSLSLFCNFLLIAVLETPVQSSPFCFTSLL